MEKPTSIGKKMKDIKIILTNIATSTAVGALSIGCYLSQPTSSLTDRSLYNVTLGAMFTGAIGGVGKSMVDFKSWLIARNQPVVLSTYSPSQPIQMHVVEVRPQNVTGNRWQQAIMNERQLIQSRSI